MSNETNSKSAPGKIALSVRNLSVSFKMYGKGLEQHSLKVISNLNVTVREGEILAIAGSSGSGKSLLAHAILDILPGNAHVDGEILYYGQPLDSELCRKIRGREMALVPQSVDYLDPLMRVGKQVAGTEKRYDRMKSVFAKYELSEAVERQFPFQLSGGMARRVLVSTAVIGDAKLIIADEPTPGLSKELAETAMGHFRELADAGAAVMLITHDIDLALEYADRIAVFYAGTTVETTPVEDFKRGQASLRHPYTKALWAAIPQNDFQPTRGTQPYAGSLPKGCLYAPRCDMKTPECEEGTVAVRELRGGEVTCIHAL